ncbi:MAG: DUF5615 family PIN-like protein [Acidimicrobiales bacterium]
MSDLTQSPSSRWGRRSADLRRRRKEITIERRLPSPVHVQEPGLLTASDEEIFDRAAADGRIVVTAAAQTGNCKRPDSTG